VIDVFGVVDMLDPKLNRTPKEPIEQPKYFQPRKEEDMRALMQSRDLSKAQYFSTWPWEMEPMMSLKDLEVFYGVPYVPQEKDYLILDGMEYTSGIGNRFEILLRKEECKTDEEWNERRRKASSLSLLDKNKDYPPTFILHGTGDTAVPVEQSYRFEERLKELGIPVGSAYCPGGEHSFEGKMNVSVYSG
jgi:acetyl esterase/lipase